ncbi:MAG: sialidase family protein [Acidimicrobiales bacterium]
MDQSVGPANNSPTVLADPTDGRFVVVANRLDAPDFGCALQVSGDGGHSWAPAQPVPGLPSGAEKCYAPEVAFDRRGVLHYLFVGLAGRGNEPMGAFLTTSADRGRSFSRPRRVLGPLNFAVRMAIDPGLGDRGRIHLVWLHATSDPGVGSFGPPPNPVLAAHSDDGGETFSEPVQVSDGDRLRVVAPALALGADHRVYVAYYDLERDAVDYHGLEGPVWAETWSVVLARSDDGGRSFQPGVVVEGSVVPHERVMLIFTMAPPALAVGGERACVAWPDGRHGDADVLVRCSSDRGRTWSDAARVNDDPVGNGKSQFLPRLALSPDGRLDAVFYDRRIDIRNLVNELFYAYSTDGGRRFAPNVKVSSEGSFSLIGQRYLNPSASGLVEFGSRVGLLSRDREVVVAWADTRNSRPNTTGQDVFSTVLSFPSAGGRGSTAALAGVVLVAMGALVLTALVVRGRRVRTGTVLVK